MPPARHVFTRYCTRVTREKTKSHQNARFIPSQQQKSFSQSFVVLRSSGGVSPSRERYLDSLERNNGLPLNRRKVLQHDGFVSWLDGRLGLLAKKAVDTKYASFLQNLRDILKEGRALRALDDGGVSGPFRHATGPAWAPQQYPTPLNLLKSLKEAFIIKGSSAVDAQLQYSYFGILANRGASEGGEEIRNSLLDFRYPAEWYQSARPLQRVIHLHIGPTNSGKTYHALKALEGAKTGVYAGPLRLLAYEVFSRMNALGKACDLTTGDEQISQPNQSARMNSCTVEMVPLNRSVDVAVVDEIQMIGDESRGWAWTQALMGLRAKELHLCGEARSLPLVRELVATLGDKLEVHTYERLSPLKTMSTSLRGDLRNLRKGDCIVVFSRVRIHAMKSQIEAFTHKRVAIVYGGLPPEVRAQQASLFNDPHNDYDFLVASDAIGMGLNLAIKRIIFESVSKSNGENMELIPINQIKQIAGRAGRFRTASEALQDPPSTVTQPARSISSLPAPNIGLVTTLEEPDLPVVRRAMEREAPPIQTAGLLPPSSTIIRYAAHFPADIPFSYILQRMHEVGSLHPRYHLCSLRDQITVADAIQSVERLSIRDRLIFCYAPVGNRNPQMAEVVRAYAQCLADNTYGELLKIPEVPLDVLDEPVTLDRNYVGQLELLHKALILYLWLSYRFLGCFVDQAMAFHVKKLVEEKIDSVLVEFSSSPAIRSKIRREKEAARQLINSSADEQEGSSDLSPPTVESYLDDATEGVSSAEGVLIENIEEGKNSEQVAAA